MFWKRLSSFIDAQGFPRDTGSTFTQCTRTVLHLRHAFSSKSAGIVTILLDLTGITAGQGASCIAQAVIGRQLRIGKHAYSSLGGATKAVSKFINNATLSRGGNSSRCL